MNTGKSAYVLDQYSNASTFVASTQFNDTVCCGIDTVNTGKSAYPSWIEVLDQYSNASTFVISTQPNDAVCRGVDIVNTGKSCSSIIWTNLINNLLFFSAKQTVIRPYYNKCV